MGNSTGGRPRLDGRVRALIVRLPWWAVFAVGVVIVVLGAVLIARPFRSLSVLHWLVALVLFVCGVTELALAARRPRPALAGAAAVAWIGLGVMALVWPDITLVALAVGRGRRRESCTGVMSTNRPFMRPIV